MISRARAVPKRRRVKRQRKQCLSSFKFRKIMILNDEFVSTKNLDCVFGDFSYRPAHWTLGRRGFSNPAHCCTINTNRRHGTPPVHVSHSYYTRLRGVVRPDAQALWTRCVMIVWDTSRSYSDKTVGIEFTRPCVRVACLGRIDKTRFVIPTRD